ncbi:MAG: 30S ribosomal protein S6 [Flavobacteriales bacterium]|jgi:small subunit ribosomal protein S6|tara:strand:+ start:160 stop:507 length:348 start_codon:yes stop_codon:yes gene_type:complete
MNNYETVFIMNPVLSDEQVRETVKKFIDYLKDKKAKISHEENWGLKKLKYAIQKKKTGFYYLLEFQAEGSIINNFEVEFQRDERVIRWQTVRLDKYAMEYADRRRKKLNEKSKSE